MLQPIAKRLLVQPYEAKTDKILIVPSQKPTQFSVVAIGDEVTKVVVGDIVYLDKYAGTEIEDAGFKYFVVEESSVLAKLTAS